MDDGIAATELGIGNNMDEVGGGMELGAVGAYEYAPIELGGGYGIDETGMYDTGPRELAGGYS